MRIKLFAFAWSRSSLGIVDRPGDFEVQIKQKSIQEQTHFYRFMTITSSASLKIPIPHGMTTWEVTENSRFPRWHGKFACLTLPLVRILWNIQVHIE